MVPVEKIPQLMKDQQLAVGQGDVQAINPGLLAEGWVSVTPLSHTGAPDPRQSDSWALGWRQLCLPVQITDLWVDGADVVWAKTGL